MLERRHLGSKAPRENPVPKRRLRTTGTKGNERLKGNDKKSIEPCYSNLSQSSCDTGYYGSSLEKKRGAAAAVGKRQQQDLEQQQQQLRQSGSPKATTSSCDASVAPPSAASSSVAGSARLEEGRVDAEAVIDELMAQARIGRLDEDDAGEEGESVHFRFGWSGNLCNDLNSNSFFQPRVSSCTFVRTGR